MPEEGPCSFMSWTVARMAQKLKPKTTKTSTGNKVFKINLTSSLYRSLKVKTIKPSLKQKPSCLSQTQNIQPLFYFCGLPVTSCSKISVAGCIYAAMCAERFQCNVTPAIRYKERREKPDFTWKPRFLQNNPLLGSTPQLSTVLEHKQRRCTTANTCPCTFAQTPGRRWSESPLN